MGLPPYIIYIIHKTLAWLASYNIFATKVSKMLTVSHVSTCLWEWVDGWTKGSGYNKIQPFFQTGV